ncbi:hypothetical protein PG997_008201 [Apiospora hydei]|uniref:Uncharacterized protein n=1 Tax=Apiospora hydei TaxID=1337664 RepID=A0ABR1WA66_9PEZI
MPTDNPSTMPSPTDQCKRSDDGDLKGREPTVSRNTLPSGEPQPSPQAGIEDMRRILLDKAKDHDSLFFIENSYVETMRCRYKYCQKEHTIVVFYHVDCFEKLADLSKADFVNRLHPLTRTTTPIPSWPGRSRHFLDDGAKKLVRHWLESIRALIARSDGDPQKQVDSKLIHLTHGSAPIENDDPEDKEDGYLFYHFAPRNLHDPEALNDLDSLSPMLDKWYTATQVVSKATNTGLHKQALRTYSEEEFEAIKRLSRISK